jgi:hypothetical protein
MIATVLPLGGNQFLNRVSYRYKKPSLKYPISYILKPIVAAKILKESFEDCRIWKNQIN